MTPEIIMATGLTVLVALAFAQWLAMSRIAGILVSIQYDVANIREWVDVLRRKNTGGPDANG
jgi:hypothetical protein